MVFGTLFFSVLVSFSIAQDVLKPVKTSDVLNLKTMSQIEISPAGDQAVFVLTSMGKDKNDKYRYFRHLYLIDLLNPSAVQQLTFGARVDSTPVWSPDSSRIAFIRAYENKTQIWILSLSGGEAFRITDSKYGAGQPQWSPDGKKILYSAIVPDWSFAEGPSWSYERPGRSWGDVPNWKKEKNKSDVKADPDGSIAEIRAWLAKNAAENDPRVFNRLNLQGELRLQTGLAFSHLFIASAEPESKSQQLTQGQQNFRSAVWSVDGSRIICTSVEYQDHPDRTQDSDLWIMNADGTDCRVFLDWEGYQVSQPRYSRQGDMILFSASSKKHPGFAERRLAVIAASGGEPRPLTFGFDRSVSGAQWSQDGKFIYFSAPDRGAFPLFRIPAGKGKIETLIAGNCGVRDYSISGQHILLALTEVTNPFELYLADQNGKHRQQVTDFNSAWVSQRQLIFPEEKWLVRPDGLKVQYWVMEPAGRKPGKKYPLVLEIHGGPSSMWGPGEYSMWHEFQLLCSLGYGVVYCNPRGSGGYGFDFRYANYRDWGHGPANDILAVASEVAHLEWVDPERQVVTGGSYAGYMTAWIVTQDHRFKAAVAQRGVYELSTFFGEGRAWRLVPNHFGGFPWEREAREHLDLNSPQTYAANIRTPLLIIHADNDIRTGLIQSEMLYKSLKELNRPVEYVRYPREGHELSRSGEPKHRMDRLSRIIEFFERYVALTIQ